MQEQAQPGVLRAWEAKGRMDHRPSAEMDRLAGAHRGRPVHWTCVSMELPGIEPGGACFRDRPSAEPAPCELSLRWPPAGGLITRRQRPSLQCDTCSRGWSRLNATRGRADHRSRWKVLRYLQSLWDLWYRTASDGQPSGDDPERPVPGPAPLYGGAPASQRARGPGGRTSWIVGG